MPEPQITYSNYALVENTSCESEKYRSDSQEQRIFEEKIWATFTFLDAQATVEFKPFTQVPGSYGELLQQAMVAEWTEEQEKLEDALEFAKNEAELKAHFKTLCVQRERVNQNTILHYWASPEGFCNQLYWNVAIRLFEPAHMSDMIALLMPSIQQALVIDIVINPENPNRKHNKETQIDRCQLILKTQSIQEALSGYATDNPAILSQFVAGNGKILSLDEVTRLPFKLHQQLYELLDSYPQLKANLYSHNDAFQQLLLDIEWHNQKGMSVNTALSVFIEKLTQSGSRYTATQYAGHRATLACVQFRTYLDQLPEEFKQTILNLTAGTNSLKDVLAHLENGNCIEIAANHLKVIQNVHSKFLSQPLTATETQAQEIDRRYRRKSLEPIGYQHTQMLPSGLQKELLAKVYLKSTADYIDCILNLPPTEYAHFLESIQVANPSLPNELAYQLTMFNEEQRNAFLKAVIKNADKFGGERAILNFIMQVLNSNPNLLSALLTLLPEQNPLAALNRTLLNGNDLLHWATIRNESPDLFLSMLALYPEDKQISVLNQKNRYGNTVFHFIADSPHTALFHKLLALYPENKRLNVLIQKNNDGYTALHHIARNHTQLLPDLLVLFPEQDRLATLSMPCIINGLSVLDFAYPSAGSYNSKNHQLLEDLLTLLPKPDCARKLDQAHITSLNRTGLTLFIYLYISNLMTMITPEKENAADIHSLEARKKSLSDLFRDIQIQMYKKSVFNVAWWDTPSSKRTTRFLSNQVNEVKKSIDVYIVHSSLFHQLTPRAQIMVITLNLILFPLLLIRLFLHHCWDKKQFPDVWWTPHCLLSKEVQRAKTCQSKITALQKSLLIWQKQQDARNKNANSVSNRRK